MTPPLADSPTLDAEVEAETAAALQRVRAVEEALHHHDVMNALTGIEGAATILVTDNVSDEDRTAFLSMLQAAVNRLRSLIEGKDEGIGPMSLTAVAADVAGEPRWRTRFTSRLVETWWLSRRSPR